MGTTTRRKTAKSATNNDNDEAPFSKHAQDDSALAAAPTDNDTTSSSSSPTSMSFLGKVLIFLVFPTSIGMLAMYVKYLETLRDDDDGIIKRPMNFEQDFMWPFCLALVMSIVVGFQTGGFQSHAQPQGLIQWPKVHKKRKVVHKYVVKGQSVEHNNDDDDDEGAEDAVVGDKKKD